MKRIPIILSLIAMLAMTLSCGENGIKLKQNVSGKAGEVLIVISKDSWESEPGSELRSILAVDYPQLPQKEPLFTLYNIPESAFSNIFRTHRNLIIVNIADSIASPNFVHQRDIWAQPQTVITISAKSKKEAAGIIADNGSRLKSIFEQAERDRIINNTKKYGEPQLKDAVCKQIGGSPYFPKGYIMKKQTDEFIWIAYETTYTNQGILIYSYPVEEETRLDLKSIIEKRNEVLKDNLPGMFPNSYMTTATIYPPDHKWVRYKKRDFAEVRGLWEMQNDFMGGPFISHSFYDKTGRNIIVLEAFVYAPKFDKRNYLRQVESILYSFEWEGTEK